MIFMAFMLSISIGLQTYMLYRLVTIPRQGDTHNHVHNYATPEDEGAVYARRRLAEKQRTLATHQNPDILTPGT